MGKLLFVIYSDESIPKNKDQRIRTTKIGNLKQTSQQLDMKKHVGVPEQLVTLPGSTSRVPPRHASAVARQMQQFSSADVPGAWFPKIKNINLPEL